MVENKQEVRLLPIKRCFDCTEFDDCSTDEDTCAAKAFMVIPDASTIPDWCPLEKEGETKEKEDG